jgi:ABC-type nickel/cobalt efflux system permease component RcnA
LGLLLGMKHALEADHLAAVASLAGQGRNTGGIFRLGLAWGLGHTLTLGIVVSLVLAFNTALPDHLALYLEMAVGVMLVLLGGDVLRRIVGERIHFHLHRHDHEIHFHAHSHAYGKSHDHGHRRSASARALLVGLVHGLAGSAALVVLSVAASESVWAGFLFTALFAIGSMAGMAALTAVIALPLGISSRRLTWGHNGLMAGIGMVTVVLGATLVFENGLAAGLFV